MAAIPYSAGLHALTRHTYAYLQPPGTWGYSNCGLVVCGGEALLVDTQFTKPLTRRLLETIGSELPGTAIITLVNTHANGDHCWGNELLPGVEIVGSRETAAGMPHEVQPAQLTALVTATPPDSPLGRYMRRSFGEFDFSGITLTPPTRTFTGRLELTVAGRRVWLHEVGPAHTGGDIVVHVPADDVLFAGDILFIGDHPIMWTGPIGNWVRACTSIIDTGARIIVPGHGPVTGPARVATFRSYLEYVGEQAERRYRAGMPYWEAAADIPMRNDFVDWGHRERLVITVANVYRNLGLVDPPGLPEILTRVAEFAERLPAGRAAV